MVEQRKRRWNGGNTSEAARQLTSAVDYTFEYTLDCGCVKRRTDTPLTRLGERTFCWMCHMSVTVVKREVIILSKSRRR